MTIKPERPKRPATVASSRMPIGAGSYFRRAVGKRLALFVNLIHNGNNGRRNFLGKV